MHNAMKAEQAITDMLMARAKAFEEKDVTAAISHMAEDAVTFSLAPPLATRGRDANGLQAWLATWRGPIGGDVRDVKLRVGEDVAFWTGLVHITGTKADGDVVDLWFRQTLGLVNTAAGWKVAHEHESVPFAMDGSGRALLDLKPSPG
ncbi:nuclear transport factor 2 family protein [Rhizobium sp. KVB221]|uniref:Nuclear transport factor 2 family protein n=1 Tax=Rhizobium setariae TaxID=2801340 RepID=A0A936YUU8_9HYPH|nr:nuclear transport factor 2 family protein [Rhizobium setariae]MBL0375169.1 nuclear transport factor 2 family protein [Rhizobium setariae]